MPSPAERVRSLFTDPPTSAEAVEALMRTVNRDLALRELTAGLASGAVDARNWQSVGVALIGARPSGRIRETLARTASDTSRPVCDRACAAFALVYSGDPRAGLTGDIPWLEAVFLATVLNHDASMAHQVAQAAVDRFDPALTVGFALAVEPWRRASGALDDRFWSTLRTPDPQLRSLFDVLATVSWHKLIAIELPGAHDLPRDPDPPGTPIRAWISPCDGTGTWLASFVLHAPRNHRVFVTINASAGVGLVLGVVFPFLSVRDAAEMATSLLGESIPFVEVSPDTALALVAEAVALGSDDADEALRLLAPHFPDVPPEEPSAGPTPTLEETLALLASPSSDSRWTLEDEDIDVGTSPEQIADGPAGDRLVPMARHMARFCEASSDPAAAAWAALADDAERDLAGSVLLRALIERTGVPDDDDPRGRYLELERVTCRAILAFATENGINAMNGSPIEPNGDYVALMRPWAAYDTALLDAYREAHAEVGERGAWLDAQAQARVGLWEVLDVVPGETLTLRDRLTGTERTVFERSASLTAEPHVHFVARVVDFDGVSLMSGTLPLAIPKDTGDWLHGCLRDALHRLLGLPKVRLLRDDEVRKPKVIWSILRVAGELTGRLGRPVGVSPS